MVKLINIAMLGLAVTACQPGERRLDIRGNAVHPVPHLCGYGKFVITEAGKVQCLRKPN